MTDSSESRPAHEDEPPRYEQYSSHEALPSAQPQRGEVETHSRLSVSEESDGSSIDENYEVESITSSVADQLTWVCVCVHTFVT